MDAVLDGAKREGTLLPEQINTRFWVVEAPLAHPVWHSYAFTLASLKSVEGESKPPVIRLLGATHELIVWALDPSVPRGPIIAGGNIFAGILSPPNFGAQIIAASDQEAVDQVEAAIKAVCDGWLSPVGPERFGDNMLKR
jgi:hypothetical protein